MHYTYPHYINSLIYYIIIENKPMKGTTMKSIGIICEYNPFHNGHAHQLHTLSTTYPDALRIAIMSLRILANSTVLDGLFMVVPMSLSNYLLSIL